MDLAKIISDKVIAMHESGAIDEMIGKHIESTVNRVFGDLFCQYGDFGKSLTAELKNHTKIDFNQMNLAEYNQNVLVILKGILDKHLTQRGFEHIERETKKLLDIEVPETIKLSKLVAVMAEKEKVEASVSFECENASYGDSRWVYLDPAEDKTRARCKYHLLLRGDGTIALVHIDGKEINKGLVLGGLFRFDAYLFRLYAAGTKVILDPDDVQTDYYRD